MSTIQSHLNKVFNDRKSGSGTLLEKLMEALGNYFEAQHIPANEKIDELIHYCIDHLGQFAIIVHFLDQLYVAFKKASGQFSYYRFLKAYRQRWEQDPVLLAKSFNSDREISNKRILVHSNSSAVISLFLQLSTDSNPSTTTLFQSISHPGQEGLLQGEALQQQGWKVIYIEDAVMGKMLTQSDMVILGCDVITTSTFVNKTGSMPIAAAANLLNVPVYVIGDNRKLVNDQTLPGNLEDKLLTESPKPVNELKLKGTKNAINYYFEHVPVNWVNRFIIGKEAYRAEDIIDKALNSSYSAPFLKLIEKLD